MLKFPGYRFTVMFLFFGLLIASSEVLSQAARDSVTFSLETGSVISDGQTPFWLFSNNFNSVTKQPLNLWLRGKLSGESTAGKSFRFNYGMDVIDLYGGHNKTYFQQAYAGVGLGILSVKAGLWEQYYGNQDPILSSGGLVWSGNARPIPLIQLKIEKYADIPFTNGLLQFKGGIAHGWLEDNAVIRNAYLHHKYMYIRLGGDHAIQLEYGLHHFVQWGGISKDPLYGTLNRDIKTFIKVFFGQGGGSGSVVNESVNALGNHVGSHNLAINIRGNRFMKYIYWQSIFEDRSGLRLKNYRDGLIGIKITTKKNNSIVENILFEFVNTTHQSGSSSGHIIDSTFYEGTGNDDYFNHSLYGGWINRKMTIGTPLITSPMLINEENGTTIVNNKVTAIHSGISGHIKFMDYMFIYTFSRNHATNAQPFASTRNQHSFMIKSTFNSILPWDIDASMALAFDRGELLGNHTGFYFSLKKEGFIQPQNHKR